MASYIVRPDSQGRISLARFGVQPGQVFEIHELPDGRIRLTPVPTEVESDIVPGSEEDLIRREETTDPYYDPSEAE